MVTGLKHHSSGVFGNSNQEVEYLKQIVNEYLDAKTIINKPLNEDVSGTNGIDEV